MEIKQPPGEGWLSPQGLPMSPSGPTSENCHRCPSRQGGLGHTEEGASCVWKKGQARVWGGRNCSEHLLLFALITKICDI